MLWHTLLREDLNVQNSCCSGQLCPTYGGMDPDTGAAVLCKSPRYVIVPGPWYILGYLKSVLNNHKTMYVNVRGQLLRPTEIMVVLHLCNSNRSHRKCTALPDTNPGRVIAHLQSSSHCGKPGLQKSVNSNILRKSLIKKTEILQACYREYWNIQHFQASSWLDKRK